MVLSEICDMKIEGKRKFTSKKEITLTRPRKKVNLLDLDDICVTKILSYLDYKSYFNVLITCKHLHAIGSMTLLENGNVAQQKTQHLIHRWCRGFANHYIDDNDNLPSDSVFRILASARKLSLRFHVVSGTKIQAAWLNCCPVAGKLYSFLVDYKVFHSDTVGFDPRPSCFSEKTTCTFQLPALGKCMHITFHRYIDGGQTFFDTNNIVAVFHQDSKTQDMTVDMSGISVQYEEKEYNLISVLPTLKNELNETSQPLDEHFLTEFLQSLRDISAYHFPEDARLYFKDQSKNHSSEINSLFPVMAGARTRFFKEFWSEERLVLREAKKEHKEFLKEFVECVLGIIKRFGPRAVDLLLLEFKCLKLMIKNKIGYDDTYDKLLRRIDFFTVNGGCEVNGPPFNIISGEVTLRLDKAKFLKCLGKLHCSPEGIYFLTIPEIAFHLPDGSCKKLAIRPCSVRGIVPIGNLKFVLELLRDCLDYQDTKKLESGLGYFFYLLLDCVCWNIQWVF